MRFSQTSQKLEYLFFTVVLILVIVAGIVSYQKKQKLKRFNQFKQEIIDDKFSGDKKKRLKIKYEKAPTKDPLDKSV